MISVQYLGTAGCPQCCCWRKKKKQPWSWYGNTVWSTGRQAGREGAGRQGGRQRGRQRGRRRLDTAIVVDAEEAKVVPDARCRFMRQLGRLSSWLTIGGFS